MDNNNYSNQDVNNQDFNNPNVNQQNFNQQFNQPYNQPDFNGVPNNGNKGFSIASLVCGICSITLCCCCGSGFIQLLVAIAGLVLGIVAKKNNYDGETLALAGIITSAIGIVVSIVMIIILIAMIMSGDFSDIMYRYGKMYY